MPEPKDYIVWQPSKELLAWIEDAPEARRNVAFDKKQVSDPFMQEAMRVFPGLARATS